LATRSTGNIVAPDIVAAILDDALPDHLTLFDLAVNPPGLWEEQRRRAGVIGDETAGAASVEGPAIDCSQT